MNKSKNFNSVLKSTLLFSLLFSIVFLSGCAFTIEELMARADQHYELKTTNDFYTALACANSVIKQSPNNAEAWEMVAMCKILYTNKEFGAVPALKKFAELKGNSSLVNACEGCIIFNEGHMLESAEKFKSAGNLGASWTKDYTANFWVSAYFYRTYGNVLENIGKIDEALEQYKKHRIALSRHEYSGNIKTETDKIVPVIKRLEALIKAQKSEQNGDLRTALNHYKEYISIGTGDSKRIYFAPEEIKNDMRIRKKIIKIYHKLDPPPAVSKEAKRHAIRAEALLEMAKSEKEYEKAFYEYNKALALAPWWADAYFNFAIAQEAAKDYEDSIRSFKLFLLASPNDPAASGVRKKIFKLEIKAEKAIAATGKIVNRNDRFIKYSTGVVLDIQTKLMWAAKDNGSNTNWPGAKSYCESYGGGGYSNWRMPTHAELAGLYKAGVRWKEHDYIQINSVGIWALETKSSVFDMLAAQFGFLNGLLEWGTRDAYVYSCRALPVRNVNEE